jgi:hypothetical protein
MTKDQRVLAIRATNAGEALVQIPTLVKGGHRALDDGPPESVLGLKPLVVDLLEGLKMLVDQAPQVGGLRVAWTVEGQRCDTRWRHDRQGRKGRGPVIVYVLSLDQMYTF